MGSRAVVVTGLGMTTPVGGDVASTWSALLSGRSGVRSCTGEAFEGAPVRIAAPARVEPAVLLGQVELRRLDRSQQFALVAAREAWRDAGFTGTAAAAGLDPERLGVVLGTGIGGILTIMAQYDAFRESSTRRLFPYTVTMTMPNAAATAVSLEVGARAGAHATVSACASGAEAIGRAVEMIRSGRADVVVTGGTEAAIHPFPMAAFAAMGALSTRNAEPERASRPFDVDRDGFVLGEGAGVLVLESAEHAASRGAVGYAQVSGVGYSSDAYHVARADPTGAGAALAMGRALADAGLMPADVTHINAHATSTPAGDAAEAVAITSALGAGCSAVVTSTKSMTGHLLGGAGAVEAIATILAIRHGIAPPTVNLDQLDPAITLDVARDEPCAIPSTAHGRAGAGLSNSFGFGGHNVTLAFQR